VSDFVLPIFPDGSLGSSVITTTWVGVFVITFFSLRLGWVLSGLVVPGYLVPLLIVKPWAAAVVFIEGSITYLLVWLYSERLSSERTWSSLFGRDRFFALVLCSVIVRLIFDAWLLPVLGAFLEQRLAIEFDYRNNLHSFGLIVISLLANQFWKPGFVRGLGPVLATIGLTYLIVRYGLMEFTNFRISNLAYLYEELASSILASPKAYIILLTTAFLASRMNLRYGWDFNGILIPALIALQWYQPLKIVATFVEAFVIYGLAVLLLRTPLFANTTIEGGRKLLLFFNISFAYKMALGYLLAWQAPELQVTDYFGFGYLLSTLVAIKMHDKDILARLTRATLQISLTGVVVGSLIGFLLSYVPGPGLWWSVPETTAGETAAVPSAGPDETLSNVVRRARIELYPSLYASDLTVPVPWEIEAFEAAVARLQDFAGSGERTEFWRAEGLLESMGYRAERVEERYLVLRDTSPERAWGLFVIDLRPESAMVVEVPQPLGARGLVEAGLALFETTGARALAVAGTSHLAAGGSNDPFVRYRTLLPAFRRGIRGGTALQVREHTEASLRLAAGEVDAAAEPLRSDDVPSLLRVTGEVPAGLDLARLESRLGGLEVRFGGPSPVDDEAGAPGSNLSALFLQPEGIRTLALTALAEVPVAEEEGDLRAWLAKAVRAAESDHGTKLYEPPDLDQLLFFDREVLTPLLRVIERGAAGRGWRGEDRDDLGLIAAAAAALDHQLIRFADRSSGEQFLILLEREGDDVVRTSWGVYVFRLHGGADYVVEVPRALSEVNALPYGTALFDWLHADALLVSGQPYAAPAAHLADPLRPANPRTLFNLVNQVLLREAGDGPGMVVQCRTLDPKGRPMLPEGDVLIARTDAAGGGAARGELGEELVDAIRAAGLEVRTVEGEPETIGYEVGRTPQARYLDQTTAKALAVLWFSPLAPEPYPDPSEVPPT
jgi:gamma-polyglutamate biosynthesis protein CapC